MADWWQRHRDSWLHDLTIGLVVAVPIFAATTILDERAADRQEVLENLRFVRDRASEVGGVKPFGGLNLHGAELGSLRLGCSYPRSETERIEGRCADFVGADLSHANLTGADLTGAFLSHANLSGANLALVRFTGASLLDVDLRGAIFTDEATPYITVKDRFLDADLTDADLSQVCWNEDTRWPEGFEPPRPDCG
jgi:uncharacterized protein YjbI with pentapeptide repeats